MCSGCWVDSVLASNQSLQGSNRTEPWPPLLLGDLGSVVWFCITAPLLGSHTSKRTEPKEKLPLDWEHGLRSIHQNLISLKSLSCHDLIKRAGLNTRQLHFTSDELVFSCTVSIMYRASPNLSLCLSAQWASLFVVNGPVFFSISVDSLMEQSALARRSVAAFTGTALRRLAPRRVHWALCGSVNQADKKCKS